MTSTPSTSIRKRVSFNPIMLTSKAIQPVDRSDYQLTRNERKIVKMKEHRNNLTQLIFKRETPKNKLQDSVENQIGFEGEEDEETFKKMVRKMTTPTVVRVQFQKQLIRNRRRVQQKLHQQPIKLQNPKSQINRAMYYTNARTFEQFTKMNKIKLKRQHSVKVQTTEQQWKKYLDKYYLSIRKVKPLLKNDQGIKLLSPNKINQVSGDINSRLQEQSRQSSELLRKYEQQVQVSPFRSLSKRQSRTKMTRQKVSNSVCQISQKPLQIQLKILINPIMYKKIEQDVAAHRTVTRKDFFVFGMSDSNSKPNQSQIVKGKIDNYWDFMFRVNFTNKLYVCSREQNQRPLKFYVGFGNNAALIKGIMHRRFWWQLVDKVSDDTNFVWTQLKISQIFKNQSRSTIPQMHKPHSLRLRHNDDPNRFIMKGEDLLSWEHYYGKHSRHEQKGYANALPKRAYHLLRTKKINVIENSNKLKIHNHLQCNYFLGNKKALFYSLRKYYQLKKEDPFLRIPLTFHITEGISDPQFDKFLQIFQANNELRKTQKQFKNIWIVKPGELTNRGRGITVCSTLDQIKIRLKTKERNSNGTARTFIIQKYIQRPLLYQRRKFDIRHYMAISSTNGHIKGYWYADGYIRTTSSQYNIKNTKDLFTHLTNDAVQKNGQDYGKFQKGNKVSYQEFKKYLNHHVGAQVDFNRDVLMKMKELGTDAIRATYAMLDPQRKEHNFQLFGLDFMLDEQLNVYLIEVNTNPCLQTSCPLLTKILTPLIENLLKLCLDPLFPPPAQWPGHRKYLLGDNALEENKFTLVFDQCQEGTAIKQLYNNEIKLDEKMGDIFEEEEEYNDEEKQWNQDDDNAKK